MTKDKKQYICSACGSVQLKWSGKCPDCGMKLMPTVVAIAYSCPMHPDVISDEQGKCPECGMKLMPTAKTPSVSDRHDAPGTEAGEHTHEHVADREQPSRDRHRPVALAVGDPPGVRAVARHRLPHPVADPPRAPRAEEGQPERYGGQPHSFDRDPRAVGGEPAECADPQRAGVMGKRPRIARADRDLDGDDRPEVVVADRAMCTAHGNCYWNLYSRDRSAGCQRYLGTIAASVIDRLARRGDEGFHDLRGWWQLSAESRVLLQEYRYRHGGYRVVEAGDDEPGAAFLDDLAIAGLRFFASQQLQRHLAIEVRIPGAIDVAKSATPDELADVERTPNIWCR